MIDRSTAAADDEAAGEDWTLVSAYNSVGAEMKRLADEFRCSCAQIPPGEYQARAHLLNKCQLRLGALERRVAELDRRSTEVLASLRSGMH